MPLPGPSKFGPVFWSRLFLRGPVEYNYPAKKVVSAVRAEQFLYVKHALQYVNGHAGYL